MNHPEEITKTTPNYIMKWVFKERQQDSSLALSCNVRSFVIELDYGYRYLLEVYSELSDISFLIWLRYHSMIALFDRPMLEMVSLLFLELYQLLQYSYDCSSVMPVHPEGGGSEYPLLV